MKVLGVNFFFETQCIFISYAKCKWCYLVTTAETYHQLDFMKF